MFNTLSSSWPPRSRAAVGGVLVPLGIVAAHWAAAVWATRDMCTTSDEIAHMTAGVAYWRFNDYRLQPENGNLPQRTCALPLIVAGWDRLPGPDDPAWQDSDVWRLGRGFLYDSGLPSREMLFASRAVSAAWSAAVCLGVFLWSRSLFGGGAALVSLAVCAADPTMLAHGPLATSDMCASLFFLAATASVWTLLHAVTPANVARCALAVTGLVLAKTSAVLIVPITIGMITLAWLTRRHLGTPGLAATGLPQPRRLAVAVAIVGVLVIAGVWLAYGLRYTGFNTDALPAGRYYKFGSLAELSRATPGGAGPALAALGRLMLLPEAFLYGTGYVLTMMQRRGFLCGLYSADGWWWYFPFTFLVKTPLATLAAVGAAVAMLVSRIRREGRAAVELVYGLIPLFSLFAVYWAASLASTLNIGHRHLLPTYPALFICVGIVATIRAAILRRLVCGAVVAGALISAGLAWPHYLQYFNGLISRDRAYHSLVDSNLDWGQDLPGLKRWLDATAAGRGEAEPVFLAYFGNGSPRHEGIAAVDLTTCDRALAPGWYCISASVLQGVYSSQPWSDELEREYQGRMRTRRERSLAGRGDEPTAGDVALAQRIRQLQYLRLLGHLRDRQPDDTIAGSMLLFQLSATDLQHSLAGPSPRQVERWPYPGWKFP